jgi:dipeptidyl aminopeptidase/acylaminoacyl peptidase
MLLLAGVATATYLIVQRSSATPKPGPGSLTLVRASGNGISTVVEILPGGRTQVVWRCPTKGFCGELTSFDWSPDGKRAAFTLDEIGGQSPYVGLHILNLKTGRDLHLPSVAKPSEFTGAEQARLGCLFPTQVSWSPSGRQLLYTCTRRAGQAARSAIFSIRADGSRAKELVIGLRGSVGWPSWSPDGRRVAFSGTVSRANDRPAVYVIGLDGSGLRLIARDAIAPSWSPDGKTIAIEPTHGGMRLVTPAGEDVTPSRGLGPAGLPAWSRDGSLLAVQTPAGTYLVDPSGAHRRRVTRLNGETPAFGPGRPAWVPGPSTLYRTPACASCL